MRLRQLLDRPFDLKRLNPLFRWSSWLAWAVLIACQWRWSAQPWDVYSDRTVIPVGALVLVSLLNTLTSTGRALPITVFAAYGCLALGERLNMVNDVDALRKLALLTGTLAVLPCLLHDLRAAVVNRERLVKLHSRGDLKSREPR